MSHKITEDKILWNNKVPGSQSKGNSFLCLTWWHEMAWGKWTEVFPELLVVEDTGSLQIQRDWEVTHHLPQTTKRLILLSISCQWRGCPMSRLETTSVVKRMLGSGTYSAETRGSWRFPEQQPRLWGPHETSVSQPRDCLHSRSTTEHELCWGLHIQCGKHQLV